MMTRVPQTRVLAAILALVLGLLASLPAHATPALVVDVETQAVLGAEDAGRPWYPASTTKLMTAYVTFEALRAGEVTLDTPVVMTKAAMAQASLQAGLSVGRAMRLEDALFAALAGSANEVAFALAGTVSGSQIAFVDRMNDVAARLGMSASHFTNPNGLFDADQYVSARDLALLAIALEEEFPEHRRYVTTGRVLIDRKALESYNVLLTRFPGTVGMKTGFVCASGRNIVALTQRDGRRIMVVLLGATTDRERAERAAQLMTQAFSGALVPTGQSLRDIRNDPERKPEDMRMKLCTDQAAAYEETREALYPMGLPGHESYLGPQIPVRTHEITTFSAPVAVDVPRPTPRPLRP